MKPEINLHLEDIPQAKLRQCEALYPKCAVMHVPPEIWSNTCVRQGSGSEHLPGQKLI